jgi:DNA-binding NarL/FixJ family response regulator
MSQIRVAIVDDHLYVREGVRSLLGKEKGIDIVGEAEDATTGLKLVEELQPDVIILDLQMPGISGAEICWKISSVSPATRILILSAFLNPALLKSCLAAGAKGYLLKDAKGLDIAAAIKTIFQGGTVFDERVNALSREMLSGPIEVIEPLSARELQVLSLLCEASTNQEIAESLTISLNTTKGHVKEIMRKLNCRNRVEVVIKAQEYNLV